MAKNTNYIEDKWEEEKGGCQKTCLKSFEKYGAGCAEGGLPHMWLKRIGALVSLGSRKGE